MSSSNNNNNNNNNDDDDNGSEGAGTGDGSGKKNQPPNTIAGFALPPVGFNPNNKNDILEHYKKKQKKGVLPKEDSLQEKLEDEIERKIKELEEVRGTEVGPEERERIAARLQKLREGGWLEGIKPTLVGKKEVPIEIFNRLVAEYENTIPFLARRMAAHQDAMDEKNEKIANLQKLIDDLSHKEKDVDGQLQEINDLKKNKEDLELELQGLKNDVIITEDELKDCKKNHSKLEQAKKDLEAKVVQLQLELGQKKSKDELESELQKAKNEIRLAEDDLEDCKKAYSKLERENKELEAKIEQLQKDLKACREELEKQKGATGGDDKELEKARNRIETIEADLQTCRENGSKRYEEVQNLQRTMSEMRNRENYLKDQCRESDKEIKDLQKMILDYRKQLEESKNQEQDVTVQKALQDKINGLQKEVEKLQSENAELKSAKDDLSEASYLGLMDNPSAAELKTHKNEIDRLKKELRDLKDAAEARNAAAIADSEDIKKLEAEIKRLKVDLTMATGNGMTPEGDEELKKELKKRDEKIQRLEENEVLLAQMRDRFRDAFYNQVADTDEGIRQFWNAVEETNRRTVQYQEAINALYQSLGFEGRVEPDVAIATIQREINALPTGEGRLSLRAVQLSAQVLALRVRVHNAGLNNRILHRRHLRPQRTAREEIRAAVTTINEETSGDVEARVQERTETYREFRRDLLNHFAEVTRHLETIAVASTEPAIAARIRDLQDAYLHPSSFPLPNANRAREAAGTVKRKLRRAREAFSNIRHGGGR